MIGVCLGMMLFLYGLFFVMIKLPALTPGAQARLRAMQSWPQTMARVTSVQVDEIEGAGSFMPSSTFRVELAYNYEVNGVAYTSQQVLNNGYFRGDTSEQIADSVQQFYPQGEETLITYDPQKPQVSMLGKPASKLDTQD